MRARRRSHPRDGETAGLHVCPLRAGGQPALRPTHTRMHGRRALVAVLVVCAHVIGGGEAQPLTMCPCNNDSRSEGFHPQHWFEQRLGSPPGAVALHWVFPSGGSCLSTVSADNCTICKAGPASRVAWKMDAQTGQLSSASPDGSNATSARQCLTAVLATPPAPGRVVLVPCASNETLQSWKMDRFHQLSVNGGAACLTAGSTDCAPPKPPGPPPPSPHPPSPPSPPHPGPPPPPHGWPAWKPRRWVNAIITRGSWPRYLATLKEHPGSINAISEYTYEINYYIKANWSLGNRVPYGLNFSRAVQTLSPKVAVTPVIAMGGSYATQNFHAAAEFTDVMVKEAVKWGWDGYTMETEIKYTQHAAIDMARFLDTFGGALHKLNKTLAVITKDTFRGHHQIGGSAVDFILPTQYDNAGVVPGFIKDQAQKYWRTCGATIDKFEAGDAVPVMDAMCTTGCHMLALWADFDGVGEPWYRAFRTWLVNATTSDGATKCLM